METSTVKTIQALVGLLLLLAGISIAVLLDFRYRWTLLGPSTDSITFATQISEHSKSLWDWMELLILPFTLLLIFIIAQAIYIVQQDLGRTALRDRTEQEKSAEKKRFYDNIIQMYMIQMTQLMYGQESSSESSKAMRRHLANSWTLTTLMQLALEETRKGILVQFLHAAGLTEYVDLSSANLASTKLQNAALESINLENVNLSTAFLTHAKLSGANLRGAILKRANLSGAILQQTNLEKAELGGAILDRADLSGANLGKAQLWQKDVGGANLKNANLQGANLRGAIFQGPFLKTVFREVNLQGANLDAAIYDEHTQWPMGFDPKARGATLIDS